MEAQRASNGLVKVISSKTGSDGDQVPQTSSSCISPLAVLGKSLSASVLQVWFPAHWAVRVETQLCSLGVTTSECRAEHTQTHVPNVRCNIKLPGQSIDVENIDCAFRPYWVELFKGNFIFSCPLLSTSCFFWKDLGSSLYVIRSDIANGWVVPLPSFACT